MTRVGLPRAARFSPSSAHQPRPRGAWGVQTSTKCEHAPSRIQPASKAVDKKAIKDGLDVVASAAPAAPPALQEVVAKIDVMVSGMHMPITC
jgi:hypothetical protein